LAQHVEMKRERERERKEEGGQLKADSMQLQGKET
jgi:hypothetical protein